MKRLLFFIMMVLGSAFLWSCQEEEPAFIFVDQEAVVADSEPYKTTIEVRSNTDWTVSSDTDWCSVYNDMGSYRGSFELVVDRNTYIQDRTATVTVTGGGKSISILVTQTSAGFGFSLPVSAFSVNNGAQSLDIPFVLSHSEVSVEAYTNSDWVKTGSVEASSLKAEISENKTGKTREAEISLVAKGGTIDPITVKTKIIQSATEDILDVLVEDITLGSEGETRRIPIQSSSSFDAVSSEAWCSLRLMATSS